MLNVMIIFKNENVDDLAVEEEIPWMASQLRPRASSSTWCYFRLNLVHYLLSLWDDQVLFFFLTPLMYMWVSICPALSYIVYFKTIKKLLMQLSRDDNCSSILFETYFKIRFFWLYSCNFFALLREKCYTDWVGWFFFFFENLLFFIRKK